MTLETIDAYELAELLEAVFLYEGIEYHGKGYSMEYVIGSVVLLHSIFVNNNLPV